MRVAGIVQPTTPMAKPPDHRSQPSGTLPVPLWRHAARARRLSSRFKMVSELLILYNPVIQYNTAVEWAVSLVDSWYNASCLVVMYYFHAVILFVLLVCLCSLILTHQQANLKKGSNYIVTLQSHYTTHVDICFRLCEASSQTIVHYATAICQLPDNETYIEIKQKAY